jgi:lipid II:glycine glycyltransferase (peptidoglycan interpeptide bridge formation enzyme)
MLKSRAEAIFEAALSRSRGRLLAAKDADGTLLAAIFYVWDEDVTYYLLTTRAPETHNGVVSRLIWEAMRESAAHGRVFDFGGIGTEGSVLFYTAFGGEVSLRYIVHRIPPVFGAMRSSAMKTREAVHRMRALASR